MKVRVKELMKGSKELQLEKQAVFAWYEANRSRRCDWACVCSSCGRLKSCAR